MQRQGRVIERITIDGTFAAGQTCRMLLGSLSRGYRLLRIWLGFDVQIDNASGAAVPIGVNPASGACPFRVIDAIQSAQGSVGQRINFNNAGGLRLWELNRWLWPGLQQFWGPRTVANGASETVRVMIPFNYACPSLSSPIDTAPDTRELEEHVLELSLVNTVSAVAGVTMNAVAGFANVRAYAELTPARRAGVVIVPPWEIHQFVTSSQPVTVEPGSHLSAFLVDESTPDFPTNYPNVNLSGGGVTYIPETADTRDVVFMRSADRYPYLGAQDPWTRLALTQPADIQNMRGRDLLSLIDPAPELIGGEHPRLTLQLDSAVPAQHVLVLWRLDVQQASQINRRLMAADLDPAAYTLFVLKKGGKPVEYDPSEPTRLPILAVETAKLAA